MAGKEDPTTKFVLGRCTVEQNAAKTPKHADVVSLATVVADETEAAVPEPQSDVAEGGVKVAVSEPQADEAKYPDGYEDEADDADCDGVYYDEAEDDCDYGSDYEDDYDYESEFQEQRPKVRAAVLTFPEAAKLEPHELDAAVERILEQSKPENATVAAPGKVRLLNTDIELILGQMRPPPIIHNLESQGTLYPADLIQTSKELEEESLLLYKNGDVDFEEFQAKIRKDLIQKGYVEVDEDYYDKRDKLEKQIQGHTAEEWKKIDFSRFHVANNDDGILYYSEEHGCYM